MKDWKKNFVGPQTSIKETISVIDKSSLQIVLVIDGDNKLLGTLTDGDISQGFLKDVSLIETAKRGFYVSPLTRYFDEDPETMHRIIKEQRINQLDHDGRVVDLKLLRDILKVQKLKNSIILVAGGLGKRLRPLTEFCPKPLLKVGDTPLVETILEAFFNTMIRNLLYFGQVQG